MTTDFTATTHDVRVSVRAFFLPDQSNPEENQFFWAYRVRIENTGAHQVQLLKRSWIITDAGGRTQTVHGDGVIGQTPVIAPGESFEYTSGTPLPTGSGFMRGRKQDAVPCGEEIAARSASLASAYQFVIKLCLS